MTADPGAPGRQRGSRRPGPSPGDGTHVGPQPARAGRRVRRRRRHLGPSVRPRTTRSCRSRSAPAPTARGRTWADLEYHDEHAPDPDSPEGRAGPAGHRRAVRRPGRRRPGPRRRRRASSRPAGMRMAVIAPGQATETEREAPAIDTGDARHAPGRPPTEDPSAKLASFTPKPTIYSRAQWGANENLRDKGSLRYFEVHAGLRPPHGERQRLHPRRGARPAAQHLRLPHAVPRLERRRLQLPGGPVRPDLGGPVRRGRPCRRRRPHPRLQRLRVRDVGHRQLRHQEAQQRDGPGLRRAVRVEAVAARHRRAPRRDRSSAPTTSRRSTGTATPAAPPAPAATSTPSSARSATLAKGAQQDWSGRELQSDLAGSDHPDLIVRRASDGRVFVLPTGGLSGFGKPVVSRGSGGRRRRRRRLARPDRRRHGRPARAADERHHRAASRRRRRRVRRGREVDRRPSPTAT